MLKLRSPWVLGLALCFPAFQSAAAPPAGPLRIHPENPRYFTDGARMPDGSWRAVYLTGAHTWNNLVDMGRSDPPEKFHWEAYLDFLEKHHHNFIRLWAWDSTTWDTRANGALGKDFVHHAAPLPWARTGPGNALDGKPKFNLAEFNPEYFERLRWRVKTAGDRGIYVSVMLFEGWGLFHGNRRRGTDDGWAWRCHPFNPANNVQAPKVEGADPFSGRVHTLRSPEVNQFQAEYVRKVVDTLNDLDNVLYEVINEGGEKEWNWWVIQTIHDHERTKPKQHPVGNTGHGAERLPTMAASPAEWLSPGRADGYAEDPPAWNENKVSLLDTDHIWGVGGNAGWVWKSFLRGHNPIFMDPYDGSVLGEDRGWEPIRTAMGYARRVAERMNLAAMAPRNELASTGYCLACPGQEYLVYQPAGGKEFSLQVKAGEYELEWIDPSQPEPAARERMNAEDGTRQFQAPFAGSALLHLKAQSQAGLAQERAPVHAVVDLGHEFTFYADGRFHRQYLPDQPVAMSWGALFHYDFANANLLILLGCDPHLRYLPEDIRKISAFLEQGGGVVLLGSTADEPQNALAREFGCGFGPPAQKPLRAASAPIAGEIAGGGDSLNLQDTNLWHVLVVDAKGNPMLARRTVGQGTLLVGARGLAGHNPDASDNINAAWWQPLLADVASGKRVDPAKPFRSRGWGELEHSESLGSITLRYSSYLKPYAKSMADIYARCRPVIERRMGVPLSEGMASEIVLLATGGGGFSSGRTLGLAVFWGGFPDREDSMIEFVTHESVHSWVLPFAEVWNEPIATYVGNLVMIDMGHEAEAQRRIRQTITRATRLDSTMTLYDLEGKGRAGARELRVGEANDIHWGKTFWIFEQLRGEYSDVVARYFQTKRRLATPDKLKQYDVHATVAVLSVALRRDLFPWFNEHGVEADPGKSPIPPVAEALAFQPRGRGFFQAGPPFTGHDLPRLRGAMISPDIDAAGLRVLGREWNANLIRWQLIRRGRAGQPSALEDYDAWLESELKKLDAALPLCRENGLYVVVDLHSPPGGKGTSGGYVGSDDRLFTDPACQAKFVQVWQRIAARYKGAQPIWGYDLVNEPVEDSVAEECDDWQGLAERGARAIRAIDPVRTIIVEPASWGGPGGLSDLVPLPISNVVYSVHMYMPHAFTHQGVYGSGPAYRYPGLIDGKHWDKAQLEAALQPVIDFQRTYGVHIYIGEFSAIRWAPDESACRYLKDLIEIFEAHGWDWSYHAFREWSGWSVEHGSDRNNTKPSSEPTNRQRLLQQWFMQNRKPAWSEERHDWPCWRGPERNGISREETWGWPRGVGDPAVLWRVSVGKGFSSFAVADGWVYTVGNTEDQDTVYCLAADTGSVRWQKTYPCELQPLSYEGGPSATPAVDGQRVYTFSKGGDLFCLNARDGTVVWSKKFSPWPYREGDWRNTWRYAGSPLVLGDRLFLSLGEAGTAFNKEDGAVVWESAAGHPGYSSPVPFATPTGEALAFFSGRAVYGVDRSSGRQLWSIPWKTLWDLNAADPIIHDGKMFVSSGNGVGCALFDISVTPPRECWRNKNLKSTINTAVLWQGHLYGFNDTHLSCLSWETGEEQWSTRDVRNGSLIVASNRLILVSETGKLVVAEASPQGYQPLAQAQVLEGRCWTTPVLSHGRLFVRNAAGQVVCLDLRKT